jgi:hypothetical protein
MIECIDDGMCWVWKACADCKKVTWIRDGVCFKCLKAWEKKQEEKAGRYED